MKHLIKKIAFNENPDIKSYMESYGFIAKTVNNFDSYYKQDGDFEIIINSGISNNILPVDNNQKLHMLIKQNNSDNKLEYDFSNMSMFISGWANVFKKFKEDIESNESEKEDE